MNTESLPTEIIINGDFETRKIFINGEELTPEDSQVLRNHSPDGFNWGYGGSGPAQLALAILFKYMNGKNAFAYYMDFKWFVVTKWPRENFEIKLNLKEEIEKIINQ